MPESPYKQTVGMTWFWEGLDRYLDAHGLKQTQQRRMIVEYFLAINSHVDADELHRKIRGDGHDIGLATIYRTLNLLRDAGLAEQQSFQDGRSLFEVATPDKHHDHLVCTNCGLVIEFENEEIEELQKRIASKFRLRLTSHRLDLYGVCLDEEACATRKRKVSTR